LYGVDDLQSVIEENLAHRRQAAVEAEVMVNQLATELMTQQKVKQAGATIHAYRDHGEELRQEELALALQRIAQGEKAEMVMADFPARLPWNAAQPTDIVLRGGGKAGDPSCKESTRRSFQEVVITRRRP